MIGFHSILDINVAASSVAIGEAGETFWLELDFEMQSYADQRETSRVTFYAPTGSDACKKLRLFASMLVGFHASREADERSEKLPTPSGDSPVPPEVPPA